MVPPEFTEYIGQERSLLVKDICQEFIQKVQKKECDSELKNTGLETLVVYILENSRKLIKILQEAENKTEKAKEILNSPEIKELGKIRSLYNFSLK